MATRVFISYAHRDGRALARRLHQDLTSAAHDVWLDAARLQGGTGWSREIERELDASDVVLALLTAGAFESEICRGEQLRALRHGKCVIPVRVAADADWPVYLEARLYVDFATGDYDRHRDELMTAIAKRSGATLVPQYRHTRYDTVPPLIKFISRDDELEQARRLLLSDHDRKNVALVGLKGMGGVGKTVLAQALCNDENVQAAFPDGIVWLRIGEGAGDADLVGQMREAARALGHDRAGFDSLPESSALLRSILKDKAVLLVLDDVWTADHVYAFQPREARCCRVLFTTRRGDVAAGTGAEQLAMDVLGPEQSRRLLAEYANLPETELPTASKGILDACDGLPLALAMIGARLRDEPPQIWLDVQTRLSAADLDQIAFDFPDYSHPSLVAALDVSIAELPELERRRYLALAVVFPRAPIPEAALETIWGTDGIETRRTVTSLVKRSLAARDASEQKSGRPLVPRIRLHDLQLQYVKTRENEGRKEGRHLHDALLQQYANRCNPHGEWHTGPDDSYLFQRLPYHLAKAERWTELEQLLIDFRWLEQKLARTSVNRLLADFDLLNEPDAPGAREPFLVRDAVRLAAYAVGDAPSQLRNQILGRLMTRPEPGIKALCERGASSAACPWLRPLNARLAGPGSMLIATLSGHSQRVVALAVREGHDGGARMAISGSWDCSVIVWDLRYGDCIHTLKGHSEQVVAVSLAERGSLGISCSYDGETIVWDVDAGRRLRSRPGPEGGCRATSILSDERSALTIDWNGGLELWDLLTCNPIRSRPGPTGGTTAVAIAADTGVGVLACGKMLLIRTADSKSPDRKVPIPPGVVSVAVTRDGTRAVCVSLIENPVLVAVDLSVGRVLYERPFPFRHGANKVSSAISADGRRALTAFNDGFLVWDLDAGHTIATFPHERHADTVALLPDGRYAVTASDANSVRYWNLYGREESLADHPAAVCALTLRDDGHALSLCEYDDAPATLITWNLTTAGLVATEQITATNTEHALLPDGRGVIRSDNNKVIVADLRSKRSKTLRGHFDVVKEVTVTPNGQRAVSVTNNSETIGWELENGRALWKTSSPSGNGVAALVPGSDLVLQGGYKCLTLWDPRSGTVHKELGEHSDFVTSLALTPDGRFAASAGSDRVLMLWDLEALAPIAKYVGDAAFTACAIAADGRHLAVGDDSGRIHILCLEDGRPAA